MDKIRILLIDDDKIVLRTIEKLLKIEGYELTIAENGQEAIEFVQKSFYDLVITDIRMPRLDGVETIQKIKKLQEVGDRKSNFMVITGYSDPGVSQQAKKMGIKHFLMKPFDKDLFLDAVKDSLKSDMQSEPKALKRVDNSKLIDDFIKEEKEKNNKFLQNKSIPIIGWTNTYVPEEIIMAAGFLSYRVMGAPIPLHLSKAYLSGNLCSSVQSMLECALNGDYNFLDGIVIGASTDATKRLYDAWIRYIETPFCNLFDIPKLVNESTIIHYIESLNQLIQDMEGYFKTKINKSRIKEAVLVCNKTRVLLYRLNELRKANVSPITSQQFLEICKLAATRPKAEFNNALESLLGQIKTEDKEGSKFRILLTGSFQDQAWLLDIIDQAGATVVCEDFCTRLRYFSGTVESDKDVIKAIAKRYMCAKPASASLVSLDERTDYMLKLTKDFKVDGIIYYILKFDDPYLFEFPDLKEVLLSNKIPVLRIETEHNTSALGQIMTRIQAFTETLKLARSRRARMAMSK